MNNRQIFTSKDGSKTIYWPEYDEHYHSVHGALTESVHVFIEAGLKEIAKSKDEISVFEMGFGTGLNAILTCIFCEKEQIVVDYTSIEAFPVEPNMQKALDYGTLFKMPQQFIAEFYEAEWGKTENIVDGYFTLTKINETLQNFETEKHFDLIYYDAFAPSAQPELWTKEIFEKLYGMLNKNGILTTYCAKGQVKRDLKAAGFTIQALPGPPGKREMTRAIKLKK